MHEVTDKEAEVKHQNESGRSAEQEGPQHTWPRSGASILLGNRIV